MKLRQIAHSRTGDKGDTSNISLIVFDSRDYPLIVEQVTAERVREHFGFMRSRDAYHLQAAFHFFAKDADGNLRR